VVAASSGDHDMTGHNGGTWGIQWPGKDPDDRTEFERMSARYGFIEMLGIEMLEGRTFSRDFADSASIIFNEAAIEFMGIADPIGTTVDLWGMDTTIVGVTKTFHFEAFHDEGKPVCFWLANFSPGTIMVRIEAGKEVDVIKAVQASYKEFNPRFRFLYK